MIKTFIFAWLLIILQADVVNADAVGTQKNGPFDISEFGAKGDGHSINTLTIQEAINRCRDQGGGVVVVPKGVYVSGTLKLFNNIHLHLESGAVLKGSDKMSDYNVDGVYLGLIFVQNATNVSITGSGTIDGNADAFIDHTHLQAMDSKNFQYTRQKEHFREIKAGMGDGPLKPLERPGQMVLFSNCRNIIVEGVKISNSPYWTLQLIDCDGAILSKLKIQNSLMIPNNTGIMVSSSSNVRISGCNVRCGDTALALSGASHFKHDPGYNNLQHDSTNITVSDCVLESRSVGIHVGGWTDNSLRHYAFDNITINNSLRGIKIGVRDQGSVEDMTFSNITITTRLFTGNWWGNGEPIFIYAYRADANVPIGRVRQIVFNNVTVRGVSGMLVYGCPESVIEDLSFLNVSFLMKESPLNSVSGGNYDLRPIADPTKQIFSHDIPAFHFEHVRNVQLRNFRIRWDDMQEPYFTNGLDFSDFEDVLIENYIGSGAPRNTNAAAIWLDNGKGYRIINSHVSKIGAKFLELRNVAAN